MFRFLSYIIGFVIIAGVFRWVMGFLKTALSDESASAGHGATGEARERASRQEGAQSGSRTPVAGNELKKCPSCGTYSPMGTALTGRTTAGETLYFCSEKCRTKHVAA